MRDCVRYWYGVRLRIYYDGYRPSAFPLPSVKQITNALAAEDLLEVSSKAFVVRPRMKSVLLVHLYCRTICSDELQVHDEEASEAEGEGEAEDTHHKD